MPPSASAISQPPVPERASLLRRLKFNPVTIVLVVLLSAYLAILVKYAVYSVGGSDATGYANLARALLDGNIKVPVKEVAAFGVAENLAHVFVPLGYTPVMKEGNSTPVMLPFYPIGLPLHEAIGVLLLGWSLGPFIVSPLLATLSCWLIYCIGLMFGLSRRLAAAGSLLLAINPTFLFLAIQPMSDGPSLFWGLLLMWAALRARENAAWMILAGFAFGVAFLVRPTNVLFLAPLFFCVPLRLRSLALFILGGVPLAAVFLSYNQLVFGHPLQTGYGNIELANRFHLEGMFTRFSSYVYWMAVTLSPLVLAGWVMSAFLRKIEGKRRAVLVAWFVPFLVLYAAYDFYDEWWYTRFLLPAYPALILGALLTAQWLEERLRTTHRGLRAATWMAIGVVLLWVPLKYVYRHNLLLFGKEESIHSESTLWADKQLPERAVVVATEMSGALRFYTDRLIIRHERVVSSFWPALRTRILESGYEFYALLKDIELKEAMRSVPGRWTELGRLRHIGLWRIEPLQETASEVKYDSGFSEVERTPSGVSWRWMSDEGIVQLRNTGHPMRLRIEGAVPMYGLARPSTMKIILNGVLLESVIAGEQPLLREYQISPSHLSNREWTELRIVVDQAVTPNEVDPRNPDRRRLGLALTRLVWNPSPE